MHGYLRVFSQTTDQISKILSAKSVDGLAPSSLYSDLVIYIVNAVYHIVSGSPFRCAQAWNCACLTKEE